MQIILLIFLSLTLHAKATSFRSALDILKEYCHDVDFSKFDGASYNCRVKLEKDCLREKNAGACPRLVEIRKFEEKWEEEKPEDIFVCRLYPRPTPYIPSVNRTPASLDKEVKLSIKTGSPNLNLTTDEVLVANGNPKESLPKIRELQKQLRELTFQLNSLSFPLACEEDSQCQSQGIGRKACGGHLSYVVYSSKFGQPSGIQDIIRLNALDRELQDSLVGWYSTCDFLPAPSPKCVQNVCQ